MGLTLFSQVKPPRNSDEALGNVLRQIANRANNSEFYSKELNSIDLQHDDVQKLQDLMNNQDISLDKVKEKAKEMNISELAPVIDAVAFIRSETNTPSSHTP